MGLGLAGITVVFLALPGMILAVLLRLGREEQAPPVLMDAGWKVIAIAFTSAFFIHFLAVFLARGWAGIFGTERPDLEIVGILAGVSEPSLQVRALQNVQEHFGGIFVYLLLAIGLAVLVGFALRGLLPSSRNWLEQQLEDLQQRDSNPVIWLTTATDLDGETWLFEGVYERHLNDHGGEPEFVFLRLAKRRRMVDDDQDERWSSIPGEIFILKLDRWHSVNLDAFYYDPNDRAFDALDSDD
ncbi:MAG: hypothetical protein ACPGJE_08000 [Wenzhouxiangellaceae bacterium]